MKIILIGPPGVGKGTEAKRLATLFNIPHISTGDMFRAMFDADTELGKIAKAHINRGELVPDDLTNAMVIERLEEPDAKQGFLFDGYPRNIVQAKALDDFLLKQGESMDAILYIDADIELITERIAGRRVCKSCGAVYHINYKKPKVDGVCDQCQGVLYQRKDDMEATVRRRLNIYHDVTAPIIHYYKHQQGFHAIDGSGNIEETHQKVMDVIQ
ncbi:MAG: adenylate kinase [Acholeplasmataceae bacterium]|jgi:adenylate kinase